MPKLAERHIEFEGCFKFRDIGGYAGRNGRTLSWAQYYRDYRAGRQDRMTDDDLAKARELSMRMQIDLRRVDELEDHGPGPLQRLGVEREWISVVPQDGTQILNERLGAGISGERYPHYLSFDSARWLRVFELLAAPASYPGWCIAPPGRTVRASSRRSRCRSSALTAPRSRPIMPSRTRMSLASSRSSNRRSKRRVGHSPMRTGSASASRWAFPLTRSARSWTVSSANTADLCLTSGESA